MNNILLEIPIVYIVMIDSGGIKAFQKFTRNRWEKLEAEYNTRTNETSNLLFKIKLTDIEANMIRLMINNKKYHAAAMGLLNLRMKRGDAQ